MTHPTRVTLRVVAVANLIFFAVGLFFAVPAYIAQYRILRDWPAADAVVVRSEVVPVESSSGQQLYDTAVQFAFDVQGRTYMGVVTSPHQSTSYERKLKQIARFPPGSHHNIRYDPAHPANIRAEVGYNVHYFVVPVFITGVAGIFLVLALILFAIAHRWTKNAETETPTQIQ
ncbi:MAG: DUF3592 domain-containing protein [Acidobacteriaceae bacterium]|nr:DUF3592 domain-containing protein [Acidobacteriaceae bacterium]